MEGWNGMGAPTCTRGTRARMSRSDTWISQTSLSFCASGSWPGYSTCHVRGRAGASPPVPFSTATSRCRNSAGSDTLRHRTGIRVEQPVIPTGMGVLGYSLPGAVRDGRHVPEPPARHHGRGMLGTTGTLQVHIPGAGSCGMGRDHLQSLLGLDPVGTCSVTQCQMVSRGVTRCH